MLIEAGMLGVSTAELGADRDLGLGRIGGYSPAGRVSRPGEATSQAVAMTVAPCACS